MTAIWNKILVSISGFFDGIVERINALGFDFENITEVDVYKRQRQRDSITDLLSLVLFQMQQMYQSLTAGWMS